MEVHGALGQDTDCFRKEGVCLFHDKRSEVIYPCLFAFNISRNILVLFSTCFTFYYGEEDYIGM
jgi:hypothetical protein